MDNNKLNLMILNKSYLNMDVKTINSTKKLLEQLITNNCPKNKFQ